jgi:hypothetical protein
LLPETVWFLIPAELLAGNKQGNQVLSDGAIQICTLAMYGSKSEQPSREQFGYILFPPRTGADER